MSAHSGKYERVYQLVAHPDFATSGVTLAELAKLMEASDQEKNQLSQALCHLKTNGLLRGDLRKQLTGGKPVMVYFPAEPGSTPPPKAPSTRATKPPPQRKQEQLKPPVPPPEPPAPVTPEPAPEADNSSILCCPTCRRDIGPADAYELCREGVRVFADAEADDAEGDGEEA